MSDVLADIDALLASIDTTELEIGALFASIDTLTADYAGVTHAGVAVVHPETGKVLLAKRAKDETDADDVKGTWEFPGGGLEDGEDPQAGAFREFEEEIGVSLEGSEVVNGWGKDNYQGFVVVAGTDLATIRPAYDEVADVAWHTVDEAKARVADGTLRPELHDFDWAKVEVTASALREEEISEELLDSLYDVDDEDLDDDDFEDDVEDEYRVRSEVLVSARGKGWATDPKETKRLHDYWTKKGEPGYAKIRWGTRGDFTRARKLIGEKIAKNSPEKMRYLNRIIAQWHHDALGYWPGDLDKPGNKTSAEAKAEREAKKADALSASITALHEESARINAVFAEASLDEVLTASVGSTARPPKEYFERAEGTNALTIEDPDENGIRRVHGYAGKWGVCHVGFQDRCVPLPKDPTGEFHDYHLGLTRTAEGDTLHTGLITYAIGHREGEQILSETPTKAHFDDVKHAWAAVRVGEDETGVWYSGYVLPHIPEEDLVLIQAAGQVSGEWRGQSLRSLLSVNVPGFPVTRASVYTEEDGVESLVASYDSVIEDAPCPAEEDPIEAIVAAVKERIMAELKQETTGD